MNWSYVTIPSWSPHPLLKHCKKTKTIYINTDKLPYCYQCKKIAPDEIIVQGKLINAFVWDEPGRGVYSLSEEKWK